MKANKTVLFGRDRAINRGSVERVDPVQNEILDSCLSRGLHAQAHCSGVSVESATDILNVVNEHIQALKLFGRWLAGLAIKAVDGKTCIFVGAIGEVFASQSADAVLRTEQGPQGHSRRILEQVNRGQTISVVAGMIGDKANTLAFERCELVLCQHVYAVEHLGPPAVKRGLSLIRVHFGSARLKRSRHAHKIEVADSFRRQCPQLGSQGADAALLVRMVAVGKNDQKRLGERINPDRSARPARVAVRAERKVFAARATEA